MQRRRHRHYVGAGERANVERLHALDAALGRELLEGTLAACFPHRRGAREIPCERDDRLGERLGVRGRDDEPRLPVGDDLGKPAHGARDDRPRALHGLERDHAEPLAERGHDDDRRVLDRGLHGRHEAEEADGVSTPSSRAYAFSAGASGPRPATSRVTSGTCARA